MFLFEVAATPLKSRLFLPLVTLGLLTAALFPGDARAQVLYNGQKSVVYGGTAPAVSPFPSEPFLPYGLAVDSSDNIFVNTSVLGGQLFAIQQLTPGAAGYSLSNAMNSSVTPPTPLVTGNIATSVALDASDNLYYPLYLCSSPGSNCVSTILENANPIYLPATSSGPPIVANLAALGPNSNFLIISDLNDSLIWEEFPPFSVTANVAPAAEASAAPTALTVAGPNEFFVSANCTLYQYVPGATNTLASNLCSGGIAVDSAGDIYATDTVNGLVVRLTPLSGGGYDQTTFTTGLNKPQGIAIDPDGNIFISDLGNDQVVEIVYTAVNFGNQLVGGSGATMPVTFTVLPGTTIGSVQIVTAGATGKDFVDGGGSTCVPATYSSATTCTVSVKFNPLFPGLRTGAVEIFDNTGKLLSSAAVEGAGAAPLPVYETGALIPLTPSADYFDSFGASASDGAGNLYIPVPTGNEILVVPQGGTAATLSLGSPQTDPSQPTASSTLSNPSAVSLDGAGDLYIADTGNNRIVVRQPGENYASTGNYYLYNLPTGSLTLNGPQGVVVDGSGNIYIADTGNNRVVKVSTSGVASVFGTAFNVNAVAVDSVGNVFTAGGLEIDKTTPTGTTIPYGAGTLEPRNADGIAVDASETVYIADSKLGVVEVKPDGTARAMNLGYPFPYLGAGAVSLDAAGNVYIGMDGGLYEEQRTAPTFSFDTTRPNEISLDSPKTVIAQNAGNVPLGITAVTYPADFQPNPGDANACSSSTTLGAGQQCDLPIDFIPLSGTSLSEKVTITDNAGNVTGSTQSIPVSGTGVVGGLSQSIVGLPQPTWPVGTYTKTPTYVYNNFGTEIYISATSGLPVTLQIISGPGNFGGALSTSTTLNQTLSFTGAGIIEIAAIQPGNSTYAPTSLVIFSVTVTPAPLSIKVTPATRVYGTPASEPTTFKFLLENLFNTSQVVIPVITANITTNSPVGTYPTTVTFTGPAAVDYTPVQEGGGLTITPAPLTVAATDAYQLVGGQVPKLGYTLLGLAAGDTASVVTGAPVETTTATASSPAGGYPIDLSLGTLAANSNYTLSAENGLLNVFAAIPVGATAVGGTVSHDFSFPSGPANPIGSSVLLTNGIPDQAFLAAPLTCTTTCSTDISFTPPFPGSWAGAFQLFDKSTPPKLLVSIPMTGAGAAPQIAFYPGAQSTMGTGLKAPTGSAIDLEGDVFIVDQGNNRVVEILPGAEQTTIGSGLTSPTGVAVDNKGNVYITDTGNDRVVEEPAGGGEQTVFASGFKQADGIAVDSLGNVYVADAVAGQVVRIPAGGGAQTTVGTGLTAPFGVAVDGAGDVFIADKSASQIVRVPGNGGAQTTITATGLTSPEGVAVDAVGDVFISDTGNSRVVEESVNGGVQIALAGSLGNPALLQVDRSGKLYIAEPGTNTVLLLNPAEPGALTFPSTPDAGTSSPQTVSVWNVGNGTLALSGLTFPAGFPQNASGSSPCTASTSLTPGLTCNVSIDFTPGTVGALSGNVDITDNSLNLSGAAQTIVVSGTGAKESQTITFPAIATQKAATTIGLSATATSGLPVSFSSLTTTICTVSGDTAKLIASGFCWITASQAGNSQFSAAKSVTLDFAVGHATQTITFTAIPGQKAATTVDLSATASSGLPVTFASLSTSVCTVSGTVASLISFGDCTIQASQGGNAEYLGAPQVSQTFPVGHNTQTITFAAISGQKAATTLNLTATASSGLPVSYASTTPTVCTISGSAASLIAFGSCTIQASQAGNNEYFAAKTVSQTFGVGHASQTIVFPTIPGQKAASTLNLTATASSGLPVSYASPTPTVCTISGSTASFISYGSCTIVASQGGNDEYLGAPPVAQTFGVGHASQTITFPAISTQVVGTQLALSATASSGLAVSFASTTASICTLSGTVASFLAAGKCTVKASQAGNNEYLGAPTVEQTFTVEAQAAIPIITPGTGAIPAGTSVTITDATPGATIYYSTVIGVTATTSSPKYTGPFVVSSGGTYGAFVVTAIAVAPGFAPSNPAVAAYNVQQLASTPTFSPAPGSYTSAQTVSLSAIPGCILDVCFPTTIYYTTDGSTPTVTPSEKYSNPISVSSTTTIKAIATEQGFATSNVATGTYTITAPGPKPAAKGSGARQGTPH